MIIIDMNQISVASLMMQLSMEKTKIVDTDKVRHMILNSIRMYRTQFNKEYGEVVLAYDSKHYWRRDYFPHYKQNRKKSRDRDNNDWESIFETLNLIKQNYNLIQKEMKLNILPKKKDFIHSFSKIVDNEIL